MNLIDFAETGWVPDALIRIGIRRLLGKRKTSSANRQHADNSDTVASFAARLRDDPLAVATEAANEQHYDVPAEFFERVLGSASSGRT